MKKIIIVILILLTLAGLAFVSGYHVGYHKAGSRIVVQCDTVVKVDTVRETVPVPVTERVRDTILVAVRDTVRRCDTLLMPLPRTEKTYSTPSYTAVVSGFMPSLDYIETYNLTQTVTRTVVKQQSPWGFSVGVGPGVIFSPHYKDITFGIGIFGGLTYTF